MVKIIDDQFMVCSDCCGVLANGDYSALDFWYPDPAECEDKIKAIDEGINGAGGYIALGDHERDHEFSIEWCDCCGTRLAGSRTHFVVLGY